LGVTCPYALLTFLIETATFQADDVCTTLALTVFPAVDLSMYLCDVRALFEVQPFVPSNG